MSGLFIINIIISTVCFGIVLLALLFNKVIENKKYRITFIFENYTFLLFHLSSITLYYAKYHPFNLTYIDNTIYFIYALIVMFALYKLEKTTFLLVVILSCILFYNGIEFEVRIMLMNIVLLFFEFYNLYLINNFKNDFISITSIKQSFDKANNGILYLNSNYEILIMNEVMVEIQNELEGIYNLTDAKLYKRIVDDCENSFLKTLNKTYSIEISNIDKSLTGFIFQFTDVTKDFILLNQLDNQNNILLSTQEELKQSIINIETTVLDEEILRLRTRVHDVIGQRLSIVHTFIENMYLDSKNFNELKGLLKNIREDLVFDSDLTILDRFEALKKTYMLVNTTLHLEGKFPSNEELSKIFLKIIREASTNAIRHASAKNVYIKINEDYSYVVLSITNDGNVKKEQIKEGDGIKGMKQSLSLYNYSFVVKQDPVFSILITIIK